MVILLLVVNLNDSKWQGTRVWPLEMRNAFFLMERVCVGKGKQDSFITQFSVLVSH